MKNIREIFMTDINAACKGPRTRACATPEASTGAIPLRLLGRLRAGRKA